MSKPTLTTTTPRTPEDRLQSLEELWWTTLTAMLALLNDPEKKVGGSTFAVIGQFLRDNGMTAETLQEASRSNTGTNGGPVFTDKLAAALMATEDDADEGTQH